eukprot:TRINITY_DN3280_c0_g2_i10.p2 TRINITY_DN3280_c0_g2~~TRINITY_DN3280_c0_g2_i10.p2  ORF type:complete len:247 (+),score=1.00 TRINITY_DN3280_c0_g2_i10:65-805(+)
MCIRDRYQRRVHGDQLEDSKFYNGLSELINEIKNLKILQLVFQLQEGILDDDIEALSLAISKHKNLKSLFIGLDSGLMLTEQSLQHIALCLATPFSQLETLKLRFSWNQNMMEQGVLSIIKAVQLTCKNLNILDLQFDKNKYIGQKTVLQAISMLKQLKKLSQLSIQFNSAQHVSQELLAQFKAACAHLQQADYVIGSEDTNTQQASPSRPTNFDGIDELEGLNEFDEEDFQTERSGNLRDKCMIF